MGAAPKKVMGSQGVLLLVLIGVAVWLFSALGGFVSNVNCIFDQIEVLKTVKGEAGKAAAQVTNALPSDILEPVRQGVSLIAIFAIIPAAFILLIEVILIICAARIKTSATCPKVLILQLTFFTILGIVFYLVIGATGIVATLPEAQAQTSQLTE